MKIFVISTFALLFSSLSLAGQPCFINSFMWTYIIKTGPNYAQSQTVTSVTNSSMKAMDGFSRGLILLKQMIDRGQCSPVQIGDVCLVHTGVGVGNVKMGARDFAVPSGDVNDLIAVANVLKSYGQCTAVQVGK